MDYKTKILALISEVQSEKYLKYIYDLIIILLDESI